MERRVDRFGEIPPDVALPSDLTWRAGVRFPSRSTYHLAVTGAPGARLSVDGIPVPASTAIDAVPGVHFIQVEARDRLTLTINGAELTPQQTYRLMDAPWGLLAQARDPLTTLLDATVSMAFYEPELENVTMPKSIVWTGSLVAPRGGTYRMAFATEDPMQLEVDGQPVDVVTVGPDGWRTVGLGSAVPLTQGAHRVQVTLEITHGGRELARWNWVPPAADGSPDANGDWSVVPPSVLRPDPPISVLSALT
jgi:hypothetical protein